MCPFNLGSIFKLITSAVALEKNIHNTDFWYNCTGINQVEDAKFKCFNSKKHENIKVERIDQNNINRVDLLSQNNHCEFIEAERIGIRDYFALGLVGIIISSSGEDIGFAICSQKDEETLQGHFMKNVCADRGATFHLLKTCIDYFSDAYVFTNTEDDMGKGGLRFFKKSLDPEIINAYTIELKRGSDFK